MDAPKISRISLTFAKGMIYDLTPKQPATCLEGNTASKYPPANSPEGGENIWTAIRVICPVRAIHRTK